VGASTEGVVVAAAVARAAAVVATVPVGGHTGNTHLWGNNCPVSGCKLPGAEPTPRPNTPALVQLLGLGSLVASAAAAPVAGPVVEVSPASSATLVDRQLW